MNFERLKTIPISGEYKERHFGITDPNPLWVKFFTNNSEGWLGSFADGGLGFVNEKIVEIESSVKVGVLYNGAFYLIDRESYDLLLSPDEVFFSDFESVGNGSLMLLASYCGIFIFKDSKFIKQICPDFIDGVRFKQKTGKKLVGEICESGLGWSEFEIDLDSLILKWGIYEFE
jgi:hypothetical protein